MAEKKAKRTLLFCATDNEIFDAYMAAPQHFNRNALLDLGISRGIFYSPQDNREYLADQLSGLIYSASDLRVIEEYFEKLGRADRRAALVLDAELSMEQLKQIAKELVAGARDDEIMSFAPLGSSGVSVTTKYSELDHGATRLKQRRDREAELTIETEDGKTIIRMPAVDRARGLAASFTDKVEKTLKKPVDREEIDLSVFDDPDVRTSFFTQLITGLPDSRLDNVLRIRVERNANLSGASELDEDEKEEAKEEMLSVVKNVALNGESLLSSPEYQSLKKRGFYITSVTWRVRTKPPGGPIVEFEAGFDNAEECRGFRYAVRQWKTQYESGQDRKTFMPIPEISKKEFGKLLESTASSILRQLIDAKADVTDLAPSEGAA